MAQNYVSNKIIKKIERKYKVKIHYIEESNLDGVDYAYSGSSDIYLSKYTNAKIEVICLCHEIAHCISKFKGKYHITVLSKEGAAWEETINIIKDNEKLFDIKFDIDNPNSEEYNFMKNAFLVIAKKNICR